MFTCVSLCNFMLFFLSQTYKIKNLNATTFFCLVTSLYNIMMIVIIECLSKGHNFREATPCTYLLFFISPFPNILAFHC